LFFLNLAQVLGYVSQFLHRGRGLGHAVRGFPDDSADLINGMADFLTGRALLFCRGRNGADNRGARGGQSHDFFERLSGGVGQLVGLGHTRHGMVDFGCVDARGILVRMDGVAHFLGRRHRFFRQLSDFIRDNRKAASRFAGTGGFNSRVQR